MVVKLYNQEIQVLIVYCCAKSYTTLDEYGGSEVGKALETNGGALSPRRTAYGLVNLLC